MIKISGLLLFVAVVLLGCQTAQPATTNTQTTNDPVATFGYQQQTGTPLEQKAPASKQHTITNPLPQPSMETQSPTPTTTPQPPTATSADEIEYTQAVFKTNKGNFTVQFYPEDAPKTVQNFQNLAARGFYDQTKFHRVIANFMIQGGDPQSKDDSLKARWGTGGPGYTFADEINDKKLVNGSLAMAHAGANTNGSQFFIVTADSTPWLDGVHTNFGEVVDGMDVVMAIGSVAADGNDRPLEPVIIESIELQ